MYLLVGFVFLLLFAMVIINGFYCQQVNWHIVDAGHFFLENKVVAKSFNTIETLQFRLLGNEEGNTSFFQAGDIPFEKIITYQVEVFLSVTLQIFAHDVDFGVKSNSVLHCRVGAEEFIQNSRQSGYFAARMLMLLARDEKEIVIFRKIHEGIVGSNQQENREIGFRQYMEEYHPSCTILELDLHAERNDEDNEMLDEFFRTYPTVKNGITFNSKAYIVGEYLQNRGKKDFNLIGYDLLERNVTCLKEGSISFLIAQQPELQGANGIKALCDHLIFKKEVTCINYMPIDLLTVETIDYYHSK